MAKIEPILAIDIGGDSLKVAEFSFPSGENLVLDDFAFAEYGGDLKEEDLMTSLSEALAKILQEKKFKAKKVYLSISGQSAFIRFSKLPPVGDDTSRIDQLVEYEAKQHMPFDMDKVVWDYQFVTNDETDEIEVMFVAVKEDFISKITDIIEASKKAVVCVETAPTAGYNCACANQIGKENCELILNIGGRCSTLVFIDGNKYFVRSIPIAGHSITQQISREFNIPFSDAEEMKRRHGFVALGGAYEEPDSEVAATVSKIIRNVMTRLHGEIHRSINVYRSQWKGRKPVKIYLSGGSSVMAFTPRFFTEKLRTKVDYLNPFQVGQLGGKIKKDELIEVAHMFSEVIGLGLRHVAKCPIEISLKPSLLRAQQSIKQKLPYFYASCASVVLCLGIILLSVSNLKGRDKDSVTEAEKKIAATEKLGKEVKTLSGSLESLKGEYNEALNMINKRSTWINVINALQKSLPDNMWLVSIKGIGNEPVAAAAPSTPAGRRSRGGAATAEPPGGMFGMFGGPGGPGGEGGGGGGSAAVDAPKEISWIRVTGHSLVYNQSISQEEQFRENLMKTEVFSNQKEELKLTDFVPARETNITSFTMDIKLKQVIVK